LKYQIDVASEAVSSNERMMSMRIPRHGWVLVCDGAKALLLRNDGDPDLLNLTQVRHSERQTAPTRALGADRPGRVYQSKGAARSATQETDLHDEEEIAFISTVARDLDRMAQDQKVKSLVVVAPPRALGILRAKLSPRLQAALAGEIPKDLAHLSIGEIEKHLAE
jgi:protein required for attachment to host cells